jgi:hypothetical protein
LVAGIHLVEMMSGLIAAILKSGWCGLGAITVKLRRDFSGLYVSFWVCFSQKRAARRCPSPVLIFKSLHAGLQKITDNPVLA